MRRINAVTFDLWDTLIKEAPGNTEQVADLRIDRIAEILDRTGHPHDREEVAEAYDKTGTFLELTWAKSRDMPVRDHALFLLSCVECRLASKLTPEQFHEVVAVYSDSLLDKPPMLLPQAKEALRAVRESGYRTALISNTGKTPGSTLRVLMDRMGILDVFDVTTFSNEIQVRKPAEAAFRLTLEQLRAAPRSAVHIGDDADCDVVGAKAVGMTAIQTLHTGARRSDDADAHVERLDQISEVLARL
ncbi:MAG: HAD family hydrolase [Thermoplasmata archaeon]|jgi:putative hydrolase of the HAD superfamily|nr:HAD family hydrolase [Thermoplasmata archaeon]